MNKRFTISETVKTELRELIIEAVNDALSARQAKDAMLTTGDVMKAYAVSRTTLWRLVQAGTLHPVKGRGRQQMYRAEECKKVFEDN